MLCSNHTTVFNVADGESRPPVLYTELRSLVWGESLLE